MLLWFTDEKGAYFNRTRTNDRYILIGEPWTENGIKFQTRVWQRRKRIKKKNFRSNASSKTAFRARIDGLTSGTEAHWPARGTGTNSFSRPGIFRRIALLQVDRSDGVRDRNRSRSFAFSIVFSGALVVHACCARAPNDKRPNGRNDVRLPENGRDVNGYTKIFFLGIRVTRPNKPKVLRG